VQIEAAQVSLARPAGAAGEFGRLTTQAADPCACVLAEGDPPLNRGAHDLGQDGRDLGEPVRRALLASAGFQPSARQQAPHSVPDRGE
jgi:hypothetical protein